MAMTNSERQQKYRQNRLKSGDSRINSALSIGAHSALKRIARYHGISDKEALEKVILDAESTLIASDEKLQRPRTKTYKEFYENVWEKK